MSKNILAVILVTLGMNLASATPQSSHKEKMQPESSECERKCGIKYNNVCGREPCERIKKPCRSLTRKEDSMNNDRVQEKCTETRPDGVIVN